MAESNPVSDQTRDYIWHRYYSASFASEYYSKLGDRFLRWHRRVTTAIALLGGGSIVPALMNFAQEEKISWPSVIFLGMGLALAVLGAMIRSGNYARRAEISLGIARRCSAISTDWASLWQDAFARSISDADARQRAEALTRAIDEETHQSGAADIDVDDNSKPLKQLKIRATKEVAQQMEARHGTRPTRESATGAVA